MSWPEGKGAFHPNTLSSKCLCMAGACRHRTIWQAQKLSANDRLNPVLVLQFEKWHHGRINLRLSLSRRRCAFVEWTTDGFDDCFPVKINVSSNNMPNVHHDRPLALSGWMCRRLRQVSLLLFSHTPSENEWNLARIFPMKLAARAQLEVHVW